MNPLISEFSYGYAVTDELIHGLGTPITAAPVFPSLYQEGQAGGGYDVMLQGPAVPLFIQFKLSHCLTTRNAAEARAGLLTIPYYRMHIRAARRSNQHALLLGLEAQGNDVYYCAPAFHKDHELNDAYLTRNVCSRSIWLLPSSIGPIPDDQPHYTAFQNAGSTDFYVCSHPKQVTADVTFPAFVRRIHSRLIAIEKADVKVDEFAALGDLLIEVASKHELLVHGIAEQPEIADLAPVQRAAVLASVLFDTQLYIARFNEAA
jgi:hypothetical protein